MKSQRCREDEAAWRGFVDGTAKNEHCMVLMRRIIDYVDAVRTEAAYRDRNEGSERSG